ncbi:Cof-type HAD-IIB family hydrolase [Fervidibacillus halotolerans]|uniref:Cof-type HAD-IIB family hydrolase n=1 Tax=Fervidibacillus halotolerans TaxID=2980027 RepID=A0A9E8M1M2_9BACI|nr:Cof-type HAD-IIB family hydrolase [Fervidibacillus halotolerans]WAA13235.1 Cof-type HAD-IIB family hydrolase [Fervidibacillus halotolerans]
MRKIVFLDIDGTILNTKKQIPQLTKLGIQQLKDQGVYVAIATGRGPFMFGDIRKELGIDTYVSFNGQYVTLAGKPIHHFSYSIEQIERFLSTVKEMNHSVVFQSVDGMASSVNYDPYIDKSFSTLYFDHPKYDLQFYQKKPISQIVLFCKEGEEKPYIEQFLDFQFVRWHEMAVDVLPKNQSKATGMQLIIERLGFDNKTAYAFGDGLNDIEMLQTVENGIAMGNSHPELKRRVRFSTKHVDEDGLYYGFKQFGLL